MVVDACRRWALAGGTYFNAVITVSALNSCQVCEVSVMYKRIFVPVDGSPASKLGLGEAVKLVRHSPVPMLLLRGRSED